MESLNMMFDHLPADRDRRENWWGWTGSTYIRDGH
jgi:hypothetical protein